MQLPAPIPYKTCRELIDVLDFGGITAEADDLLSEARVNTPTFSELLNDKVDLVIGCKGSGKTAMFRLCVDNSAGFFEDTNTILINGADEPRKEPAFQRYSDDFEKYSEDDFEMFWKTYFVYLLNDCVFRSPTYKRALQVAKSDLKRFEKECGRSNIPLLKSHNSLIKILHGVISFIKSIKKVEGKIGVDGAGGGVEFQQVDSSKVSKPLESPMAISIAALLAEVEAVLKKTDLKVWIMLDRLDEVFPRRSDIERKALRSLLRCLKMFHTEHLRLKIFLRDDVFESVTEGGFAAFTHIKDRCSDSLTWDREEIIHLVLKRALQGKSLARHFGADLKKLDKEQQYRAKLFYSIFPGKIEKQDTIDWLYNICKDGKEVVAPRDIIELLRHAKRAQVNHLRHNTSDQQWLLSQEALTQGFVQMSKNKKESFLRAEFYHLYDDIIVFEQGTTQHGEKSLKSLLKAEWLHKVKALESIGFLRHNRSTKKWTIPRLYWPCLSINSISS